MTSPSTVIVVPCFDEAARLDRDALAELAGRADARITIVDDGSTDGTGEVATAMAKAEPDTFSVLVLDRNRGKGEAVRHGLLAALDEGAGVVGYYDADLATPPAEMARLVGVLRGDDSLHVVMGSRVAVLGTDIQRSMRRHYLGRVFATAASLALGMVVYDTQCGAKVLRDGPALRAALATPFRSRWAFDVELIGRLRGSADGAPTLPLTAFREEPLTAWHDRGGSKLTAGAAMKAGLDVARVARQVRRHDRITAREAASRTAQP